MRCSQQLLELDESAHDGLRHRGIGLASNAAEAALGTLTCLLGGDPSAGSPTDTLLRLNPACRPQVRIRQEPDPHLEPTRMV